MNKQELVETSTHTPPTCPGCGALLLSVLCEVHEIYSFMPLDGFYSEKPDDIGNDYKCPACKIDLSSVFPDGVVDWETQDTRTCTICGDAVPVENLRAHLRSHNPNADGLDGHEILALFKPN